MRFASRHFIESATVRLLNSRLSPSEWVSRYAPIFSVTRVFSLHLNHQALGDLAAQDPFATSTTLSSSTVPSLSLPRIPPHPRTHPPSSSHRGFPSPPLRSPPCCYLASLHIPGRPTIPHRQGFPFASFASFAVPSVSLPRTPPHPRAHPPSSSHRGFPLRPSRPLRSPPCCYLESLPNPCDLCVHFSVECSLHSRYPCVVMVSHACAMTPSVHPRALWSVGEHLAAAMNLIGGRHEPDLSRNRSTTIGLL